jgi:hypothetical protein
MCQRLLLLSLIAARAAHALVEEYYTTNAICKQRHCINPVFPGLDKLSLLESTRWTKYSLADAEGALSFCKNYVDYDFALPILDYSHVWNFSAHTLMDRIIDQQQAASSLYFFHVSAMGLDAWDHANPEMDSSLPMSSCVRQVARMACFTYFPKASPGVTEGGETRYVKPCKSSCENYIKECNVECCDDSVQCVFDRKIRATDGASPVTLSQLQAAGGGQGRALSGYADFSGPSSHCTGSARGQQTIAGLIGAAIIALSCGSL